MKHFPIFFSGRIPLADIVDALATRGIQVRGEMGGRMVAEQIPSFLRADTGTGTDKEQFPTRLERAGIVRPPSGTASADQAGVAASSRDEPIAADNVRPIKTRSKR